MKKHIEKMIENTHKEMMEKCSKVQVEIKTDKKCEHCKNLGAKYVGVKLGNLRCPVCGKM